MVSYLAMKNLTFFMDLDTEVGTARSLATHAALCNTLSFNKLCPKTVKILALKGLKFSYPFITKLLNPKKRSKKNEILEYIKPIITKKFIT